MSRPAQARPTAAPDRAPAPRGVAAGAARTLRGALVPSMLAGALALGAPALGASPFGPLTAQSLRGEPLRAVVELPGADAPSVRLAVAAGYARFGLVRDPALDRLTLRAVIEPDGKRFLRIETDTPVDTAELVLLLETPDGLRRAYRLRLDSPEPADRVNVRGVEPLARLGGPAPAPAAAAPAATTVATRSAAASAPGGASRARTDASVGTVGASPAASATPAADAPVADRDTAPAVPIAPPGRPDAIEVVEGSTLDALAQGLRPPGATLEQSALALWRANPRGFAGRPPRPIAGVRLSVPGEADVLAVTPAEARAWVAESGGTGASAAPAAGGAAVEAASAPAARAAATAPVLRAAAPRAAPSAFDADLAETLRRTRELRRRVDALKAGFEATARREEATMRALIDTPRRAADPPPR
ncbi:MAG: hypothetical protein ACK51M_17385 [Burkholderiales bacterium]